MICTLLGLWSPWLNWGINISDLFGVESPDKISGLEVYSVAGTLQVFVDDDSVGSADPDAPLFVDGLEPGTKAVRIVRDSDVEGAYWTFNQLVNFEENINVVISYYLGPEAEFSSGHIITAEKKDAEQEDNLIIKTDIEGFNLDINGISNRVESDQYSTSLPFNNQIVLKITESGYEETEFRILPEDEEERLKLEDYIITVDIQMLLQPVTIV